MGGALGVQSLGFWVWVEIGELGEAFGLGALESVSLRALEWSGRFRLNPEARELA